LGEVIVERQIDATGTTTLAVTAADGSRFPSPQTMLDKLLGALTFDPLEFSRLDGAKRSETLRRLVNLDTFPLDRANQITYEKRTDLTRQLRDIEPRARAAWRDVSPTPPERVDVAGILARMEEGARLNSEREREVRRRSDRTHKLVELIQMAANNREQAQRLLDQANAWTEEGLKLATEEQNEGPILDAVDVSGLRRLVEDGTATNAAADRADRALLDHTTLDKQSKDLAAEIEKLTAEMDARTQEKRGLIAAAQMPVEGLTFDEEFAVHFRGLPFEQASSAEQLRVSVAIAMAANPRLRILRIKDGSLLDESNLAAIAAMAEAADYQIWVERVDTSGKVGVVMQDGTARMAE
jgi:hypothetical protein